MNYLRKKLQAIITSADFKGYLREVTGTDSVTLTDCMGSDMTSLSLVGNAVQDGTPSPDNPVEIQGCGDRTANLFDKDNASVQDNWTFSSAGDKGAYNIQNVSDGETITIAFQLKEFFANGSIAIRNASNSLKTRFSSTSSDLQVKTITYAEGDKFNIYAPNVNSVKNNYMRFVNADVRIYKGSYTAETMPPYEPYGYKIPVEVSGRNLLDYTKATDRFGTPLTIINNGVSWDSHVSYYFFIPCDLKSGMTVRFSCKSDYPENSDIINSFMVHYVDGSTDYRTIEYSITLKNDVDRIQIRKRNASIESETPIKVTDIMLVQGSYTAETMPPYEPYHAPQTFNVYTDKPLYATGDVGDEITLDFDAKTATRTDKIKQLKDFEVSVCAGIPRQTEQCIHLSNNNAGEDGVDGSPTLSTHFVNVIWVPVSTDAQNEGVAWYPSGYNRIFYIYLNKTRIDMTADDTTATLATKCNAYIQTLTGREVYYQLLTPATTDISALQDWDTIPKLWRGTVTVSADTTIQPSSMAAQYYATKKED